MSGVMLLANDTMSLYDGNTDNIYLPGTRQPGHRVLQTFEIKMTLNINNITSYFSK